MTLAGSRNDHEMLIQSNDGKWEPTTTKRSSICPWWVDLRGFEDHGVYALTAARCCLAAAHGYHKTEPTEREDGGMEYTVVIKGQLYEVSVSPEQERFGGTFRDVEEVIPL
jgi:hypothetical protein